MGERIVTESNFEKNLIINGLAEKYNYEPWRVRIFDMQRASVQLHNPPKLLLPEILQAGFRHGTLIMQGNGFTFTTSETTSVKDSINNLWTPYHAKLEQNDNGDFHINLTYDGIPVDDFNPLRLIEIMGKPPIYYFPFKNKDSGKRVPTYLVVNPYEYCAYKCLACSRLPYFKYVPRDYAHNIRRTIDEVLMQIDSPNDLKFINIITGSMPTAEEDIKLFQDIIEAFNKAGFDHCKFGVYTPNITTREQMQILRNMNVIFFTVTLEVTTAEARRKFYGDKNAKGHMSFEQILDTIKLAEEIFPYANTNIMMGYEPADETKENLLKLSEFTQATVNHFIPRIFLMKQLKLIHPLARNLEYYVDLCSFIEREINASKMSFGQFFEERFGIPKFGNRFRS